MIVFLSNFYNHHQSPLSQALYKMTSENYYFIATGEMSVDRSNLGWGEEESAFVKHYYSSVDECQKLINQADVLIFGGAPYKLIINRLKESKLVFVYTERIFKKKVPVWQMPLRRIKNYIKYGRYKNIFLLCASAFTAADYEKTLTFREKAYKWGYFPAALNYNIDEVINNKKNVSILWVSRYLEWKHPEIPILLAKRLKDCGYDFELNMIGTGDLQQQIENMVNDLKLHNNVHILGAMKPGQVREYMEKSQIFLFTSDRNEGWGAVLNESMNSACAVVASSAIGSVPFLLKHGENGLIYEDGNIDSLYNNVESLLNSKALCNRLGEAAYETIIKEWNANVAAKKFLELIDRINNGEEDTFFDNGICSKAEIISDDWFSQNNNL